MEEMSSMTKQNADHANQAKGMMTEANRIVEKVDHHMQEMAGAVGEITRSSEETGKIIKTIDEIAFQTNLLAANAEESAAAAEELNAQAEQMKVYVEDLVKVAGGSGNGHGGVSGGHGGGLARIEAGPRKGSGFSEKKAIGRRLTGPGEGAKIPRRPAQVIPLVEGEFRDF